MTSIGEYAFGDCTGLTSVTIPDSVTSISACAFYKCTGLTSVTIPDSVTSIGGNAFGNCSGLTSVIIGNSVTSIGMSAFHNCDKLIKTSKGIRYVDTWVIGVANTTLTTAEIKDGTKGIASYAFRGCSGLTSVTIPDSVTSVDNGAFEGCSGLTSVTIGNSVTSIGNYAFRGCSNLASAKFKHPYNWETADTSGLVVTISQETLLNEVKAAELLRYAEYPLRRVKKPPVTF